MIILQYLRANNDVGKGQEKNLDSTKFYHDERSTYERFVQYYGGAYAGQKYLGA
jgi:hypothetical protein